MLGEGIYGIFSNFGQLGLLFSIFVVFVLDSMVIPTIPEFFAVLIFTANPTLQWGILVVIIGVFSEMIGATILYLAVKKARIPRWISSRMERYVNVLILKDEKIILLNRAAPVVPFIGAFIAVCKWSYKKAMFYTFIGGFIKYSILLSLSGVFYELFESGIAQKFTLMLVAIVIGTSFLLSRRWKKKMVVQSTER